MITLTVEEKKVFNNISQQRDPDVKLGDLLAAVVASTSNVDLDTIIPVGTPVNAVSAEEILSVAGVVIHGETVTIGDDVYEFTADADETVSAEGNIAVGIEASTTKSSGTLTMDIQPISGDKVTIGTKVFTFVPVGTDNADGEVSVGDDLAGAKLALVAAINGKDDHNTAHPLVTAAEFGVADACVITAIVGGTAGDDIDTIETFTAGSNAFAADKLVNGADCTAANAITALVAAITDSDTQGVSAVDGENNTIDLTTDLGGVAANEIVLVTDMANGSFTGALKETTFSGGENGSIAIGTTLRADDTYLYLCFGGNTINEKNWRRIELDAAF